MLAEMTRTTRIKLTSAIKPKATARKTFLSVDILGSVKTLSLVSRTMLSTSSLAPCPA